jgi:hypothetical protein
MNTAQRQRAILAVAAALNSTTIYSSEHLRRPEAVREMLLGEMEDYFASAPVESSQFDREPTLEYVRTEPLDSLVATLDEMGKNPFSQDMFHVIADEHGRAVSKWEAFAKAQSAKST